MERTKVFALAVVVTCLGLAACGSSKKTHAQAAHTVPKSELIARGDAICAKNNKQLARTPAPKINPARMTPAQLKKVGPGFSAQASVVRADVSQVKAIGEPTQDKAVFDRGSSEAQALAVDFDAAAAAAAKGDAKAFQVALAKAKSNPASKTAAQFGFKVCGHR